MADEMIKYYSKSKNQIKRATKSIEPGKLFAYFEGNHWHRVKCEKIDSLSDLTTILFIDLGGTSNVNRDSLFTLKNKFRKLAPQVFYLNILQNIINFA